LVHIPLIFLLIKIFTEVGLIFYFSFQNTQRVIKIRTDRLLNNVSERVAKDLKIYFAIAILNES
jgi:hypothetical protein